MANSREVTATPTQSQVASRSPLKPAVGVRTVGVDHPEFPSAIKALPHGPQSLWIAGELHDVDQRAVAVVGSREASGDALRDAFMIGRALAQAGHTVVSGLARGIDGAAHRGALSQPDGRTIAIVGTPLDTTYPPEHAALELQIRQRGAVISPYPPGTPMEGKNFSGRNALIAALSVASVVVAATERSGTRVEAEQAVAQGRRVFLWEPLTARLQWTAALVRRGEAEFTRSIDDLIDRIGSIA